MPILQKEFIDLSIADKAISYPLFYQLLIAIGLLIVIDYVSNLLNGKNINSIQYRLFNSFFTYIMKMPQKALSGQGAGFYYTVLSHDLPNAGRILSTAYFAFVFSLIRNILIFRIIYEWDKLLGWLSICSFVMSFALSLLYRKTQNFYRNATREKGGRIANSVTELISNSYTILVSGKLSKVAKQVDADQKDFKDITNAQILRETIIHSLYSIIDSVSFVLALLVCAIEIIHNRMQYGTLLAIISYFELINSPIDSFLIIIDSVTASEIGINRMLNIKDQVHSKPPQDLTALPTDSFKKLKLQQVSYQHNQNANLLYLDTAFEAGKTVALVGMTGEGKSTIIDLISGTLIPVNGSVLYNNVNISMIPENWYNSKLNIYSQNKQFFNANLDFNIALGSKFLYPEQLESKRSE